MRVELRNLQRRVPVSPRRILKTARTALNDLGRPRAEVHLTVVDDRLIRRLSARYLRRRRSTDVLTFPLEGPGPSGLWGEIVVSAETARRQAARLGVPVELELDLLVVHGLLHLAGYDDGEPREARLMHEREREILERQKGRPTARLWRGLLPIPRRGATQAPPRLRRGRPGTRPFRYLPPRVARAKPALERRRLTSGTLR